VERLKLLQNTSEGVSLAVQILKNSGIVAIPTETVYGLCADASNPIAIQKIFTAKNRPQNHPLILHIKSVNDLEKWAVNISNDALVLAKAFWPGPLTILLNKSDMVLNSVTAGSQKVAIRVPSNEIFNQVLSIGNFALVAPSANIHKKTSPTKAEHVIKQLDGLIDAVLDGGDCAFGLESTIVDCTSSTEQIQILRPGPISKTQIENIIKKSIGLTVEHNAKVSGNMKEHYQPNKPSYLLKSEYVLSYIAQSATKYSVIYYSEAFDAKINNKHNAIKMPTNPTQYAKLLYSSLHSADQSNSEAIIIEYPQQTEEWLYINDRLQKACQLT
jgi:L-threonylcarbamoyladenylate synthase